MLRRVAGVLRAQVGVVFEPAERKRRLHIAEATAAYGAKGNKPKRA